MNIDAKAWEIAESDEITVNWGRGQGESVIQGRLAELIAAALLAVRNEALEEAAQMTTHPKLKSGLYGSQDFMFGWDGAAHNIATAIRALKQEG